VGDERIDTRHGEKRAERECHGGRVPHFHAGDVYGVRQLLTAPLRRRRKARPATLRPGAIGLLPAPRRGDGAIRKRRAGAIADGIEWRDDVGCELAGFCQHGLERILAEVAEQTLSQRGGEARAMLERKRDIGNRRLVGHGRLL